MPNLDRQKPIQETLDNINIELNQPDVDIGKLKLLFSEIPAILGTCKLCHQNYIKVRSHQQFCSEKCSALHRKRRQLDRQKSELITC
jgi:hypothetical protein